MAIYGTKAEADTYHSDRGNAAWGTAAEGDKDSALIRATEWIDRAFRMAFPGEKTGLRAQEREWPRINAYDDEDELIPDDEIPAEILPATYEAALREVITPGSLSPDYDPSSQVKREKVDVVEVEYAAGFGPESVHPVFPIIRGILAPILTGSVASGLAGSSTRV
jgi:hypothetical protein